MGLGDRVHKWIIFDGCLVETAKALVFKFGKRRKGKKKKKMVEDRR